MIDPNTMKILGDRLMVRRYERPEMSGSIIIPEMARTDQSRTLWEYIRRGPGKRNLKTGKLETDLDREPEVGDILRTRAETGIHIDDGFWLIPADQVEGVYTW